MRWPRHDARCDEELARELLEYGAPTRRAKLDERSGCHWEFREARYRYSLTHDRWQLD